VKKGKIKTLKDNFGFISSEQGESVFFHFSKLVDITPGDLHPGIEVEYEDFEGEKGLRASVVAPVGSIADGANIRQQRIFQQEERDDGGYRFFNPYNFVRFLPLPYNHSTGRNNSSGPDLNKLIDSGKADLALVGKCPPPGHDRYVALSGRIECRAEAVTPLFISDSHEIIVGERKHRSYRFFRYDGEKALPAASIRGVIRSVFEAATNSCMAVFNGEKKLSYHFPAEEASKMVPARVEKKDGKLVLRLLPGTTPVDTARRPRGKLYAAWVHLYGLNNLKTARDFPTTTYSRRKQVAIPDGWDAKKTVFALLEPEKHLKRGFEFWNVKQLAIDKDELPQPNRKLGERVEPGWLYVTNHNIKNKHDERFFFRVSEANRDIPEHLPLTGKVKEDWAELIRDYQERRKKEIEKRREEGKDPAQVYGDDMAISSYILEGDGKLCEGDLLYAILKGEGRGLEAVRLAPASVPRVSYDDSMEDLLPENLKACANYSELCPACRIFGWVRGDSGDGADEKDRVAYKGRLRFHHGRLTEDKGSFKVSLAILSSPKPTTTRFYLIKKDGGTLEGLEDSECYYNCLKNRLRGRKFYRHHSRPRREEYERKGGDARNDEQNRTLLDALNPESSFQFAIDFDNLAAVELGALLWSLEIDGCCHRAGYAKPLGFGSLKIDVLNVSVLDVLKRYSSLESPAWFTVERAERQKWVESFKAAMVEKYQPGGKFDDLPNIKDMINMLGETPSGLPVHYPRPHRDAREDGKNYVWFMGNKRGGRNHGPRLALSFPGEDMLPVIDKSGR